ncbi:MAG: hypothetical protein DLM61_17770, partial [Pseudonocardiales bacterium]
MIRALRLYAEGEAATLWLPTWRRFVFNSIGLPELLILLGIILLVLGPKRLPGLGRSLGSCMREFKDSI